MTDGVLVLEFHMSLTTLFKWDRALTAIDPYDSRDEWRRTRGPAG